MKYTQRLMSDMYAQDTVSGRKALLKTRQKLGDLTPILLVLQNALHTDDWHVDCAKFWRVRYTQRLMFDMYALDTSLHLNFHRKSDAK